MFLYLIKPFVYNSPSVVGQCYWVVYYSKAKRAYFCLVLEPVIVMSLIVLSCWIVLGITIPTPVITILISNPEVCILGKSAQLIQELRFFLCIYPGKEERSTKVSLCIVTVQLYRASLSVIQDCWSFIPSHCEHKTSLVTATQGTFG